MTINSRIRIINNKKTNRIRITSKTGTTIRTRKNNRIRRKNNRTKILKIPVGRKTGRPITVSHSPARCPVKMLSRYSTLCSKTRKPHKRKCRRLCSNSGKNAKPTKNGNSMIVEIDIFDDLIKKAIKK